MKRSESVAALARENPQLRSSDVEAIVDVFLDQLAQRLAKGGRVELRGFGVFSTRDHCARLARNLRSGEFVHVPASRSVHFRPSTRMKERIQPEAGEVQPVNLEELPALGSLVN